MADKIMPGCISAMIQGKDVLNAIVQVLSFKALPAKDEQRRFRLVISDTLHQHSFTMMSAPPGVETFEEIPVFSVIHIQKYQICEVQGKAEKKIILITAHQLLQSGENVDAMIGNPITIDDKMEKIASKPVEKPTNIRADMIYPINGISPYSNKWVIKARVTSKSTIRTWSNAKGEGKLFSIELKDETGEIRVTAFKNEVDRLYDLIEVDKVYYISKCQLKPANKMYTSLNNDYEMVFNAESEVIDCTEEVSNIPSVQYNIIPISQITHLEANSIVDIMGVAKTCGEVQSFTARSSGKNLQKREVTLVDTSNASVQLTLWGEQATTFDPYQQAVILLRSARVTEFGGGKSISLSSGSTMKLNPETSDAVKLRNWFSSGAAENITNSVSSRTGADTFGSFSSQWLSFEEAKSANLGAGDKADYFQLKGMVHMIKMNNAVYKACPQPDCNKKIIELENNMYRCEKCNSNFPSFKYRLLLNALIGDFTGNRYVTCFTEVGEALLGKTAQEIGDALNNNTIEAEEIFQSVAFKNFIFKLRTKLEYYGDSPRHKITVTQISPVNYKEYNAHLMKALQEFTGIGKNM